MAESEPGLKNKAITDGQQPVHSEAGDLAPGGILPADVASAPGIMSDSHGKFAAEGTGKGAAGGASVAGGVSVLRDCNHSAILAS